MDNKEKNIVGEKPIDLHNGTAKELREPAGAAPTMNRFFGSKERTFWTFQAVGWAGYSLVRAFQWMINGFDAFQYMPMVFVATVTGFLLSLILRHMYRLVRDAKLSVILVTVVLASGLFGAFFSTFEVTMQSYILDVAPYQGIQKLGNAMFEGTVLFAWSAIYFGYHYYESLQDQKEQVLKATAAAHQAQLKMLRYQLNPHFLFNTLNAISTLVLEKSEADANRMLTKLSSFLRYTLVNQPTQRITLDQELHALGLYLDIEKVRFQDRLVLEFDIQEKAKAALIPSLILQPLVENAIKYAIAPSIEGGTIKVSAEVINGRLHVFLSDSGPGIEDLNNIVSETGSGVGIVNTRERLTQIYGEDHTISLRNMEPSGLGIFIEIPCEHEKRT